MAYFEETTAETFLRRVLDDYPVLKEVPKVISTDLIDEKALGVQAPNLSTFLNPDEEPDPEPISDIVIDLGTGGYKLYITISMKEEGDHVIMRIIGGVIVKPISKADKRKEKEIKEDKDRKDFSYLGIFYKGEYKTTLNRWKLPDIANDSSPVDEFRFYFSDLEDYSSIEPIIRKSIPQNKQILTRYLNEKRNEAFLKFKFPPNLSDEKRVPEYLILVVKNTNTAYNGLFCTYLLWNDNFDYADKGFPLTRKGYIGYYTITGAFKKFSDPLGLLNESDRTVVNNAFEKIDMAIKPLTPEIVNQLRTDSYERFKAESLKIETIIVDEKSDTFRRGKLVELPLLESLGKDSLTNYQLLPDKISYENTSMKFGQLNISYHFLFPPLLPPLDININFKTGKDDISGGTNHIDAADKIDADNKLEDMLTYLKYYPPVKIKLEGYTSCKGSKDANKDLSQRRAEKTATYIKNATRWGALALNAGRVSFEGMGEHPACTSESDQSDEKKHRVIKVSYTI